MRSVKKEIRDSIGSCVLDRVNNHVRGRILERVRDRAWPPVLRSVYRQLKEDLDG